MGEIPSLDLGKQGRLPGRGDTLEAARRMSRGKRRDHCASVGTHQGTDMVVAAMAIPPKTQKTPRILSPEIMSVGAGHGGIKQMWLSRLLRKPSSGGKDG